MDNTPADAEITKPKRVIEGSKTDLECNNGLYVDPQNGDIYSVNPTVLPENPIGTDVTRMKTANRKVRMSFVLSLIADRFPGQVCRIHRFAAAHKPETHATDRTLVEALLGSLPLVSVVKSPLIWNRCNQHDVCAKGGTFASILLEFGLP